MSLTQSQPDSCFSGAAWGARPTDLEARCSPPTSDVPAGLPPSVVEFEIGVAAEVVEV